MPCKPSTKLAHQSVLYLLKFKGIVTKEGVVLATEKHEATFLLEESKVS